jgi:hypothetical protein
MRGVPRWSMLHLAQAIMIACEAPLGAPPWRRRGTIKTRFIPAFRPPDAGIPQLIPLFRDVSS